MKEYKVELTNEVESIIKCAIRDKKGIIKLLLESITLLTYGEKIERPEKSYMVLRVDKMKRLFFVQDSKITTFSFPFGLEVSPDNSITVYDSLTDLELDGANLTILKTIYVDLFGDADEEMSSLMDLDADLERIMDSFDIYHDKDKFWEIIKKLMEFESGYLRLDYDEERENGLLHPLNHLDINYSTEVTYKIGLNNRRNIYEIIDLLDLNTNCSFIR